jgi:hypothetical protein
MIAMKRQLRLRSRPAGISQAEHYAFSEEPLGVLPVGRSGDVLGGLPLSSMTRSWSASARLIGVGPG